jgi:UDP-glucose 4-epimerase
MSGGLDLAGRRMLVTGAAGFIGSNLIRALSARGARVHAVVRPATDPWRLGDLPPGVELHHADLLDRPAVEEAVCRSAPDFAFHLAKHRGDPARMDAGEAHRGNLEATGILLEAMRRRPPIRFIHAGSSLEYDLSRSPLREDDAAPPTTVHGVTKAAATRWCQRFARIHRFPAVVLRFFSVYGPWEDPGRFIPRLIRGALTGRAVPVTRGGLRHDRVFVADVVEACLAALAAPGIEGEVFNVATGRESTHEEVIAIVERATGRPVLREEAEFPPRPWDAAHWRADVTKARRRLGWQASHDLRGGIERTVAWFRSREEAAVARQHA